MKKFAVVTDCPIDTTVNVLKGKCKAGIILRIREGRNRFGQLKKEMAISEKLLAIQLRDLEEDGLITKSRPGENPLQTFYSLTADGQSLCGIIRQIEEWGTGYKLYRQQASLEPVMFK